VGVISDMSGNHARPVAALVLGAAARGVSAAARLAAEVASGAWRRLGPTWRLVTAMVLAWPAVDVAQWVGLLPDTWLVTVAVSAAMIAVCAFALVWRKRHGIHVWNATGGRAWNEHQNERRGASPLVVQNCRRLDDIEQRQAAMDDRLNMFLGVVVEACTANGTSLTSLASANATTVPQLRLIQGGGADQEAS
jgi:hypothetical protein